MKKIESHVDSILIKHQITSIPIPIRKLAKDLGLFIRAFDMGPGVSGALLLENEKAVIGVNPFESKQRRRFTIAHEIGHFILHRTTSALFVDKNVFLKDKEINGIKVHFRDDNSSLGELKMEKEANAFAASLLMPMKFLAIEMEELRSKEFENDEAVIKELAKRFNVSQIAMTFRLTNLGFLE